MSWLEFVAMLLGVALLAALGLQTLAWLPDAVLGVGCALGSGALLLGGLEIRRFGRFATGALHRLDDSVLSVCNEGEFRGRDGRSF